MSTHNQDVSLECEVAVVGGGVMGSSAAHYLAEAGRDTVLIDQFPLPHSRGSSGGHTRITRLANYGHPALTAIMKDSFDQWLQLEHQSGVRLFRPAPLLAVGLNSSENSAPALDNVKASIHASGGTPEALDVATTNQRFRTSFPSNYKAVVDPSAGVLMADKCLKALQNLFINNGGRVLDGWPVTSIIPGKTVELRGPKGRVRAQAVVLCPGPWAGTLLDSLGVQLPVRTEKIGVYYWKVRDSKTPAFTFIDLSRPENHFYALPDYEYPGYMKVCYHAGPQTDPDERDKVDMSAIQRKAEEYVKNFFPCLEPKPSVVESCMYTVTPDESFVLDRHPLHHNLVFGAGFSGTGFKIAPACGKALARMAMGLQPQLDFSPFGFSRFNRSKL
ncbi:peroxisomal sarcosine oxidase-like [Penaeus japonicus]|uniref:peroxisomal sarcosine oxidase-like n=1 Tax=Penaeus japonicus TaxID=27405 RepID=UPI001C70EAAA|nr:peroxisomal sarcosine oxidase-like [Penaeus japonicus]